MVRPCLLPEIVEGPEVRVGLFVLVRLTDLEVIDNVRDFVVKVLRDVEVAELFRVGLTRVEVLGVIKDVVETGMNVLRVSDVAEVVGAVLAEVEDLDVTDKVAEMEAEAFVDADVAEIVGDCIVKELGVSRQVPSRALRTD